MTLKCTKIHFYKLLWIEDYLNLKKTGWSQAQLQSLQSVHEYRNTACNSLNFLNPWKTIFFDCLLGISLLRSWYRYI